MDTKGINEKLLNMDNGDRKEEKRGLGKYTVMLNCILGSVTSTLVIMVLTFLNMLFSSGENGRREAFFNTLYFESKDIGNGKLEISLGVTGNTMPIFITVFLITALFYGIYLIIQKKRCNKEN